jgi:phage tail protein X
VSRHAAYTKHEQGLDAVLVEPGRLPAHLPNALHITFPDLSNSR